MSTHACSTRDAKGSWKRDLKEERSGSQGVVLSLTPVWWREQRSYPERCLKEEAQGPLFSLFFVWKMLWESPQVSDVLKSSSINLPNSELKLTSDALCPFLGPHSLCFSSVIWPCFEHSAWFSVYCLSTALFSAPLSASSLLFQWELLTSLEQSRSISPATKQSPFPWLPGIKHTRDSISWSHQSLAGSPPDLDANLGTWLNAVFVWPLCCVCASVWLCLTLHMHKSYLLVPTVSA